MGLGIAAVPVTSRAPLRVVVVMSIASPWARLIAGRLAASGLSVHVLDLTPHGPSGGFLMATDPFQQSSIADLRHTVAQVVNIPMPRPLAPRMVWSAVTVRRVVRQCRAEVLLTLGAGSNAAVAYLSGVRPYVIYAMGSDILMAGVPQKAVARYTLAAAAAVPANGQALAARTAEISPRARVVPLCFGIDLREFRRPSQPVTSPVFVTHRGFLPVYDNATIVRALGLLGVVAGDFGFSFLAAGPLVSQAKALADAVVPQEWREQVRFMEGVDAVAMREALQTSACYVSASLSDGTSTSLLEALACGLYPIVSDIPANREWIVDGENGMLFPTGDHAALAERMRRAIGERQWLTSAAESNRQLVEDRGDIDTNIRVLVDLLYDAC